MHQWLHCSRTLHHIRRHPPRGSGFKTIGAALKKYNKLAWIDKGWVFWATSRIWSRKIFLRFWHVPLAKLPQPIRETPMCLIVFIIQVFQLRLVWICNEPSEPIEQPFRDEKTLHKYKTSRAKVGISWMGFVARKRKHTKYHDGSCTTSPEAIIGKLHKLCNYYFGAPALKQVMFNHRFPIQNHPYTWKKSWCLPFFFLASF